MKERASQNSEESTRFIFASGFATMESSTLVQLPRTDTIKIRIVILIVSVLGSWTRGPESLANPAFASELQILKK